MKFVLSQFALATMAATTASAFVALPTPSRQTMMLTHQSVQATDPIVTRNLEFAKLHMAASNDDDDDDNVVMRSLSTQAKTLLTASLFAFTLATTVLPAPADAFTRKADMVPVPIELTKTEKAAKVKADAAAAKTSAKEAEKINADKKLSPAEKEKIAAKQQLDLSANTIKEYEKYVSVAKEADSKAFKAVTTAEKPFAAAKSKFIVDNDKLTAAKSQKMPTSAIKELTETVGRYRSQHQSRQERAEPVYICGLWSHFSCLFVCKCVRLCCGSFVLSLALIINSQIQGDAHICRKGSCRSQHGQVFRHNRIEKGRLKLVQCQGIKKSCGKPIPKG
jgi:hypothetical protein